MIPEQNPGQGGSQGWFVAAYSDQTPNTCGQCFEVACVNQNFRDGYGQELQRDYVCYDESKSVIVKVADRCDCEYPANYYSNKRWCCGDMPHLVC